MRQRIISFLLVLVMLMTMCPAVFAVGDVCDLVFRVSPSKSEVNFGESFQVILNIGENPGFKNAKLDLLYDASLVTFTGADYTDTLFNSKNGTAKEIDGGLRLNLGTSADIFGSNIYSASGKALVLNFTVNETVTTETKVDFALEINPKNVVDANQQTGALKVSVNAISVTVGEVEAPPVIPPVTCEHVYEIVPAKDATCTEKGSTQGVVCKLCGLYLVEPSEIAAMGHAYESVVTEPTYTAQGYTTHTCVNCGDSYVDSYTGPLVPETDVKVIIGTVTGMAGDTLEVYLTLENAPELKILAISDLVYDTEHLTLISGEWLPEGSMLSSWNPVTLKGVHAFGENTDLNGDVFKLTFTINEDAPAGVYEIRCQVTSKQRLENGSEVEVPMVTESGAVEVIEYTPGDVDGNEFVTTDDAIYLLYHIMFGEEDYAVNQNCDFDGNGFVTTDDAIYLLYHIMFGETDYPLH